MSLLDLLVGTPMCYAPFEVSESFQNNAYAHHPFWNVNTAYYAGCDREHRL